MSFGKRNRLVHMYLQVCAVGSTDQTTPYKASTIRSEREIVCSPTVSCGGEGPLVIRCCGVTVSYKHLSDVTVNHRIAPHSHGVGGVNKLRGVEITYDIHYYSELCGV